MRLTLLRIHPLRRAWTRRIHRRRLRCGNESSVEPSLRIDGVCTRYLRRRLPKQPSSLHAYLLVASVRCLAVGVEGVKAVCTGCTGCAWSVLPVVLVPDQFSTPSPRERPVGSREEQVTRREEEKGGQPFPPMTCSSTGPGECYSTSKQRPDSSSIIGAG